MPKNIEKNYINLLIKVKQHEETIGQLIEIIAVTNCKVSELKSNLVEQNIISSP